jgi:flagellar protein FlbD
MITLTKIDGNKITVNADEIETVESSHDTIISLKSGRKIVVQENYTQIITLVIEYRRKCNEKIDEKLF